MNTKSIFFIYRLLQAVLSPLVLLYFLLRCWREPRYFATLSQRLGFLPPEYRQTVGGAIWFHAVSVGEVMAIAPLIEAMLANFPCAPIFVSSTTLAGYETAVARLKVRVFYVPVDYVSAIRRVLRKIRPGLLVIAETEIWPNLFREAKRTGCGVAIVNARMSDGMAPRYRQWRLFFGPVLALADKILAQSPQQRDRFIAAGAEPDRVVAAGNLKYDFTPRTAAVSETAWLAEFKGHSKLLIAASTAADRRVDEEDYLIDCAAQLPGWKLLLAPRHTDRFDAVADKLAGAGVAFCRRSKSTQAGDILLLDTIGELGSLFGFADVVFMGGTLVERGGHNILEPAFFERPIVVGPHMENFREMAEDFRAANAFVQIECAAELPKAVLAAAAHRELGARAKACADARRGAVPLAVAELSEIYRNSVPRFRRTLLGTLLLVPLAQLWRVFRRRSVRHRHSLGARVVSVGNITAGGTGKTPTVLYIAERAKALGRKPGILTRGHGRTSHRERLLLEPREQASAVHTGDEAQIFLRSGAAHLGIGSDRVSTGRMLRDKFQLDTLILDDGFQQFRVARDVDLLLIDAMNPFGGEAMLPLGRLREPLSALRRATAILITRTECNRPVEGIERRIRRYNPSAPIFRSRVVPQTWVNVATGETYPAGELPFKRMLAFCGLGNAESFWSTLRMLKIDPQERLDFDDHHRYSVRETQRLGLLAKSSRLEALLTTQKDVVNLCESTESIVAPAQILWLKIGVEIDDEPRFLKLLFP